MITQETKKIIQEQGFFDFMGRYSYLYSNDELSILAKEYAYAVYRQDREVAKKAERIMWEEIELDEEEE